MNSRLKPPKLSYKPEIKPVFCCRVPAAAGACRACKAQVLSGTVALGPHEPFALTEADQKLGLTLLCSAKATSDCEIKVRDVKLAQKKPEGVQAEIVEKRCLIRPSCA